MTGRSRVGRALLGLGVAAAAGCAPARRAETTALLRAARHAQEVAADSPEPLVAIAQDRFVADLAALAAAVSGPDPAATDDPAVDAIPDAEAALRARLSREGRRDVSAVFVRRIAVHAGAPPARLLEEVLSVAAEKAGLDADEAEDLGAVAAGGRAMRVALLDMGQRPFRSDYRWAFSVRFATRPDGAILVRYDLTPDPETQRVTLFQGVGALVPDGEGTRWVEAFAVGSPSSVPFFLKGKARAEVDKIFARRARRLAERGMTPR